LLSSLGETLAGIEPGFTSTRYGHRRLIDLLRSVPEFGQLRRREDGHPEFTFQRARESETDTEHLKTRKPIWDAVTAFHPPLGGWKLDLASLTPERDAAQIAAQPERYLTLPDAGVEFQQAALRAFVAEHAPELAPSIDTLLTNDAWFSGIRDALGGHREAWVEHRRRAVVRRVIEWADAHGIPRTAVIEPAPRPAREATKGPPTRALLHRLIDRLDDEEVRQFPVPAWCLRHLEG